MSKRGKVLIAIALAAGVLLVPALTIESSNGSANIINELKSDKNFINSIMIINNSITSNDIKNNSIKPIDLAPGVLTMRGYGKVLGGSLVANASRNLTVRNPIPEVMCVSVTGVADAAKLAPQISGLLGDGSPPFLKLANAPCRIDEFAVGVFPGEPFNFTILVP